MSTNPTPEEVRASIVPKSDQLNADNLLTGPITVTITGVRRGDKDQPIIVDIEGYQPYKPCKTMRRVLIATFGDDPKDWRGHRMTLYCDPDVMWAGVKIGGIRISHLSGLDNPRTFMLTQTRGKRTEVTIQPLADYSKEIAAALAEIAAAKTPEALKAVGVAMKNKPEPVRDAIRAAYAARAKALTPQTPLAQFEAEIEAAKGSKSQLMALVGRVDQFGDEAAALSKRIQGYWAVAAEGT
jgi:hypothetical protein